MQKLQRNEIIDAIASNSKRIPCIFLNQAGSPSKLHTDMSTIDLLVSKEGEKKFLDFCRSHAKVKEIIINPRFERKKVAIKMLDGSEVSLKLLRNMVRKTLCTLPTEEIMNDCHENSYGVLVPTIEQQYEYILMKSQFSNTEFPDKFQKYFSAMEPAVRSSIFKYLQTKYNFVFNTIEDLYKPKSSLLLRITIGLRALPENSLSSLIFRGVRLFIWNLGFLFSKKAIRLGPMHSVAKEELGTGRTSATS